MNSAGTEVKKEPTTEEGAADYILGDNNLDEAEGNTNDEGENDKDTIKAPKVKLLHPDDYDRVKRLR